MKTVPSAKQLAAFVHGAMDRPVVLFYEFRHPLWIDDDRCAAALAQLAPRHGGEMRWAAVAQQAFIGDVAADGACCSLHFPSRNHAKAFVTSEEHVQAVVKCESLQVAVLTEQPWWLKLGSNLMVKVLPRLPFDDATDDTAEPQTSTVIPTEAAVEELKAHPDQDTPIVMVNWLKFRPQAEYVLGGPTVSGREAYHRYGKVALLTTHSIGAKLIFAGGFRQILIGADGDPATDRWNEVALMQYPGRASFLNMTALRRYRVALHHREAGLAPHGQGLSVTQPAPQFTWQKNPPK